MQRGEYDNALVGNNDTNLLTSRAVLSLVGKESPSYVRLKVYMTNVPPCLVRNHLAEKHERYLGFQQLKLSAQSNI